MYKFNNITDVSSITGSITSLSSQKTSVVNEPTVETLTFQSEEASSTQSIAETNLPLEYQIAPQLASRSSLESPGCLAIINALSNWILPFLARRIGIFLEPYLSSRTCPVTDLRAVVIPSLKPDGEPWPINVEILPIKVVKIKKTDPDMKIFTKGPK